jgi:hypothetical protein
MSGATMNNMRFSRVDVTLNSLFTLMPPVLQSQQS